VSWEDFVAFESLLTRPDAPFEVAFRVFDIDNNGSISFDEFRRILSDNLAPGAIPFDFDSNWVKLYLGNRKGGHHLGYKSVLTTSPGMGWCTLADTCAILLSEFTQLMKGLQGERLRQAFRYFDPKETGFIQAEDFSRIMTELVGHKLSDAVLQRLPALVSITTGARISYSDCIAFHNVRLPLTVSLSVWV
jgi:solute carrier family 25 aspartate/glutamate transporter 12/13